MPKQLIVKRRSLLARIRRALLAQDRALITDRNSGQMAVIDNRKQTLVREIPDLETFGRA